MKFATFNEFVINAVTQEDADNCYKKKQHAQCAQVDDVLNRKEQTGLINYKPSSTGGVTNPAALIPDWENLSTEERLRGIKILDSITIAKMLGVGHETAKADCTYAWLPGQHPVRNFDPELLEIRAKQM